MKILFVTPYFPKFPFDYFGEVVLVLAKEIHKLNKGNNLEILTPVFISDYNKDYYKLDIYYPEKPINNKIARILWLIKHFNELTRRRKFDIINMQWVFPTGLVLLFFLKPLNSKIIVTARGSDIYLRYKNIFLKWLLKKIFKKCNAAISISHDLQDKVKQLTDNRIKKYILPSIGIDFKFFKSINKNYLRDLKKELSINDKKVILFIGGLKRVKGVDILIKALVYLNKVYKSNNFICILIGQGKQKNNLIKVINKNRLTNRIIFTGRLKYELLKYYYKCADVFVLPSRSEGLGAVLLEALYFKLPVIASNTGGIKDLIIHEKNGFLVPVGDYKKIAEYLHLLLNNKIKLQNKNVINIKKYNYNYMAKKTLEIYQNV